jgi:hypothetical protein
MASEKEAAEIAIRFVSELGFTFKLTVVHVSKDGDGWLVIVRGDDPDHDFIVAVRANGKTYLLD